MTTNNPEVWAIIDNHCATGVILIQHGPEKLVDGDRLIRLSDYEALQAECEKLRGLLAEIGRGCSRRDMPLEQTIASWEEAIDDALQE